jgi:rhodanese-related sulfurtransferase
MTKPMTVEPVVVRQWQLENREFVLLDCREQDEYDFVHLTGSVLFPMSEIGGRLEQLMEFRDQTVVVYCHHGVRSHRVAQWLQGNGFPEVYNLAGGIDRWSSEVDPQLSRY